LASAAWPALTCIAVPRTRQGPQPSGAITRVVVAVSSSHPLLDDAAVDTVRALGRVSFPSSIRPRVLRVRLPVEFAFR